MNDRILICTDLDRTLLPNGVEPESPGARALFRQVAERPETTIGYVTGRHLALALEALTEYELPNPDWLVADVGTSIYRLEGADWTLDEGWHADIAESWGGKTRDDLERLLHGTPGLELQPPDRQGRFKLSYYTPPDPGDSALLARVEELLRRAACRRV